MDHEAPRPRLCHLHKRPDFAGYGFNLHADKGKAGQYIGNVDPGSPAEAAGLREGDRIVEVNGVNVGNENHGQVVQRIKSVPDEVKFLVVDSATDDYYRERKIVITSDMENVERIDGSLSHEKSDEILSTDAAAVVTADAVDDAEAGVGSPETPQPVHQDNDVEEASHHPEVAAFAVSDSSSAGQARLCELKKWPDFAGYGFNLQANRGEPGHFIGRVDSGSPAQLGGVREDDRIVEVNGINVESSQHDEVVNLIKSIDDSVTLLVVDPATDQHFKNVGITIAGHMSAVERIASPDSNPAAPPTETATAALASEAVVEAESPPPSYFEASATPVISHPHRARLCTIYSWKDGRGYGFSMQAQKGENKVTQFVGKIDAESPSEAAGLRQGDRIVEVNGDNIEFCSHKEVVEKIKSVPDEVRLLVIDKEADVYFTEKGIKVSSSMEECIERISCPKTKPEVVGTFAASVSASATTHHPHRARLCVIYSWKDGRGYGFSMQAQKGDAKSGQFIGKVDSGSPADLGGLRQGDRIIKVNGDEIDSLSHKEVVEKIKSVPDTVRLLVVDAEADKYFKEKGIKVTGTTDDFVDVITCPSTKPATAAADSVDSKSKSTAQVPHRARLCTISSWKDGRGYGFSMQAQKGDAKSGQFIGKIDPGTPADLGGLRQGDRIIEVNGSNVESLSHKEVVEKIKSVPDTVKLLVVDAEADKYFKEKDIKVTNAMDDYVERITSPTSKPASVADSTATASSKTSTTEAKPVQQPAVAASKTSTSEAKPEVKTSTTTQPSGSTSPTVVINGIEFAPSAEEARKRMSKRKSVIDDKRSMKDKYELFQKM